MRGQKPKDAARLEEMTRYRLRIQQLTLLLRSTLHTTIIANNHYQQADRHAALFRALLGDLLRNPDDRDEPLHAVPLLLARAAGG